MPVPNTVHKITISDCDEDVYPAMVIQDPPSFWSRFKKSIANMMANVFCGVAERNNRPYNSYNVESGVITISIPPV